MERRIQIIITEDQALMRRSLNSFLNDYPGLEVVAEAANGRELLDFMKTREVDVVLLDIEMPVLSGMEALKILRLRFPETRVIILSLHKDTYYIKNARDHGANGYLSKDCMPEQLVNAIMSNDKRHFFMEDALMNDLALESLYSSEHPAVRSLLSNREKEVLQALCDGKSEKEIAQTLHISPHTVHFHRMNLHAKTRSHNLADLLRYARNNSF